MALTNEERIGRMLDGLAAWWSDGHQESTKPDHKAGFHVQIAGADTRI
jgi:hypothetical protein